MTAVVTGEAPELIGDVRNELFWAQGRQKESQTPVSQGNQGGGTVTGKSFDAAATPRGRCLGRRSLLNALQFQTQLEDASAVRGSKASR